MSFEITLVLILLAGVVFLYSTEWLPIDLVTLLLLVTLVLTGILTPQQAFSGFASEIIIVLASIFVISGALVQTGVMDWLGRALHRLAGRGEGRVGASLMGLSAAISALISNTSATAILLPATMELASRSRLDANRLMMPLAFASILGGTCTVIGTSTNMAASGFMQTMGMQPFALFEFFAIGLVIALVGILYMATLGRYLLPQRGAPDQQAAYLLQEYFSELVVPESSPASGRKVADLDLAGRGVQLDAVLRGTDRLSPHGNRKLRVGDRLLVRATRKDLVKTLNRWELSQVTEPHTAAGAALTSIGEAVLMPQSRLAGKTLSGADLPRRFGLTVLALYRRGRAYPSQLMNARLTSGDVLLLQGATPDFDQLQGNPDLWGLNPAERAPQSPRKGIYVLGALLLAIIAATLGWLPLSMAFLMAAIATVALGCISMEDAYAFIEWRLLVLIAGMMAFGLAMDATSAADFLAKLLVQATLPFGAGAADHAADPVHVERRGGACYAAHCPGHRHTTGHRAAAARRAGHPVRFPVLHRAPGARLPAGIRTRQVPLPGLRARRRPFDRGSALGLDLAGSHLLAFVKPLAADIACPAETLS
jgi:di/tricarboxylate transporter